MMPTELYTVASGPSASGDLDVPDPSPAEAEKAIAENLVPSAQGQSQQNQATPYLSTINWADIAGDVTESVHLLPHVWDAKLGRRRQATPAEAQAIQVREQEGLRVPDGILTPSFEVKDPGNLRRQMEEFKETTVLAEIPGVGTAYIPRDPEAPAQPQPRIHFATGG